MPLFRLVRGRVHQKAAVPLLGQRSSLQVMLVFQGECPASPDQSLASIQIKVIKNCCPDRTEIMVAPDKRRGFFSDEGDALVRARSISHSIAQEHNIVHFYFGTCLQDTVKRW